MNNDDVGDIKTGIRRRSEMCSGGNWPLSIEAVWGELAPLYRSGVGGIGPSLSKRCGGNWPLSIEAVCGLSPMHISKPTSPHISSHAVRFFKKNTASSLSTVTPYVPLTRVNTSLV